MSSEETKRNPATRLYEVLNAARRISSTNSARVVWCEVFNIDNPQTEDSLLRVQTHLLGLRKLFAEVEKNLRQVSGLNESLFVEPVKRLARVVDLNLLHDTWVNYRSRISDADMLALKYCEDLLAKSAEAQENEIPTSEIQSLLKDLNELYESIAKSALPQDLKTALLNLIRDMWNGIHEYHVRGASALHDVLEESVGTLAVNKEAIEENKDSDQVQALGRMLTRIDNLYSFAKKVRPLLEAASNVLPDVLTRLLRP